MRGDSKHSFATAFAALFLAVLLTVGVAYAQPPAPTDNLTELSMQELMSLEVTSASKKEELQHDAPGAITVITQEDIRRSGATSIADVLRQVPGLSVASLDANKWSVTARGFGGRFANKLLVLVDGVSTYSPLFSGVFWESEDIPLESIDRIEIIRGPGGSLWGANAVNGVINITTFPTRETHGGLLSARAGTEERMRSLLQYGGSMGQQINYRVWTDYHSRDDGETIGRHNAHDEWYSWNNGLRIDWRPTDDDTFTFIAKTVDIGVDEAFSVASLIPPYTRIDDEQTNYDMRTISSVWYHTIDEDADFRLGAYYTHWEENGLILEDRRDTFDIDFHQRIRANERHELVFGGGVRLVDSVIHPKTASFDPASREDWLISAFVQDDITLIEDRLRLVLGTKVEHNDYTGVEVQPTVRMVWTPTERNTVWGAITRAVRTPSRSESDVTLPSMAFPGILINLVGDKDFESENLVSYELGYRTFVGENLSLDFAVFLNDYDDLRTTEFSRPRPVFFNYPPYWEFPIEARNNMTAQTAGAEVEINWTVRDWWRIRLAYSYMDIDLDLDPESFDVLSETADGDTPTHQLWLQHYFQVSDTLDLTLTGRYVDALPSLHIDDYVTMDARIAWHPRSEFEIALVGRNLLDASHQEYGSMLVNTLPSEVERSVYLDVRWKF